MANKTLQLHFMRKTPGFDVSRPPVRSEFTNRMFLLEDANLNILETSENGNWKIRTYSKEMYAQYKLRHSFQIDDGTDLLIASFVQGITLFKCENNRFTSLATHELNTGSNLNWNTNETDISFGRFYPNISQTMMITRTKTATEFYEISSNDFSIQKKPNTESEVVNLHCEFEGKMMIVQLRKAVKQMVICRVGRELRVFDFDGEYHMKLIMKIPYESNDEDQFYFTNISGQPNWMDTIVFNSKGMFVYRFEENFKDFYKLINYNPMFSAARGWTEKHMESVKFEDINGDGIDDFIFTGPGGVVILSYDLLANKWKSLLNVEQLAADERYTRILHVIPPRVEGDISSMIIFSQHSNAVHLVEIVETPEEILKIPSINDHLSFSTPECRPMSTRIYDKSKTLHLKDQNIWSDQVNMVNPRTGKPLFTLPLVGTTDDMVMFHLIYDGNNNANSPPLGAGWSMYQNFIALSYQEGNFEEDEHYVWFLNNMPHKLQHLADKSSNDQLIFQISENRAENVRVSYTVSSNTWEIDYGNGYKLHYGKINDGEFGAIATDLGWTNWRGHGFDTSNLIERTHIWYLASAEFKGIVSTYEYEEIRITSKWISISFSAGARLIKIRDNFNEISFLYESQSHHPTNKGENVNIYLASYTYRTRNTEQTVLFKRSLVGESLLLTTIEQIVDGTAQPVVHYEYTKDTKGTYILNKTILPTGVQVVYNYNSLGSPAPITKSSAWKITVPDDYNVSNGRDFTLISYLDKNLQNVHLRMFTHDLNKEIYPSMESREPWPQLHYSNAETHEILIGDNFIGVIIYSNGNKQICLLGRQSDDNWKVPPQCYNYHEESTIVNGKNYVLISDPTSNVFLIEWLQEKNEWAIQLNMNGFNNLRSIATDGNRFIIYDDEFVSFGYKTKTYPQVWNIKELTKLQGFLSETRNLLLKFHLNQDTFKSLWSFFSDNAVRFRQNLVVISWLVIHNNKVFVTKIKTFVIGRKFNVVSRSQLAVIQDDFSEDLTGEEFDSNGDKFSLKYAYKDDRFRIEVATFKSPTGRKSNDLYQRLNNPYPQRFLLNLKNYYVSLHRQAVQCRNGEYYFAGEMWRASSTPKNQKRFENSTSIPLGERFVLSKTDQQSTVKLCNASNQGVILDFGVQNIGDLRISYPVYIASHGEESLNVVELLDGSSGTTFEISTLPKSMQLSPFGNAVSLIATESNSNGTLNLFIWPMYLRRFVPNFVVTSMKVVIGGVTAGSKQRLKGYIYNENSMHLVNNEIHYKEVTVLPGNKQNKFGSITFGEKSVDYFNDKGDFVKRQELSNSENEEIADDLEENPKETTLYDRTGEMEIARFPQILLSYLMASYVGFEDYETKSLNWIYDEENIIKGNSSLTGENYLRLTTKPMKGIFKPKFQDRPFIVTSWIRTPCGKSPNIQDIVPFLTVIVQTVEGVHLMHFLAEVKLQIDHWSYLEVVVDMDFMHLLAEVDTNLKLEIMITPFDDVPLDLDNIRFSSLRNIFDVNVYDNEMVKCTATIKSNGAITRFIYDRYQRKIADINESNQIEEFITYTKILHHRNEFGNPNAVIKIIPKKGYFQYIPVVSTQNIHKLHVQAILVNDLYIEREDIDSDSYGIRLLYSLPVESEFHISNCVGLHRTASDVFISLRTDKINQKMIPAEGEVLLVKQHKRIIVWIDGNLYFDEHTDFDGPLAVSFVGDIQFGEMMVFSQPQVRVNYRNALNEEIQEIILSSTDKAIVRAQLYDELGRQGITTKTAEIVREPQQSLMSYVADFVINDDPNNTNSVWKTGRLKGAISFLIGHEFGYSEVVYDNNPLNTIIRIGLAGQKFSASGEFARHLNSTSSNHFLISRYPPNDFTYQVQSTPSSGGQKIYIFNQQNRPIAVYVHVENGRDRFSTFEYNDMGLMTKCLPSLYYEKVGKFDKISLDLIEIAHDDDDDDEEKEKIAIYIDYNSKGNPTSKRTPDTGPVENVYDDDDDRLRFIIQYWEDAPNRAQFIVYFEYDAFGRLTSTGNLAPHLEISRLLRETISEDNAIEYQRFYYTDYEEDPMFRGNLLRTITMHNGKPFHEEIIFDARRNVISKRVLIPNGSDQPEIIAINNRFEGDLLKEIIYPGTMFGEQFRVAYEYDILGRMEYVGVPGQSNRFLKMTYNTDNLVASETITPLRKHEFSRRYLYNEPGFLIEINDPLFREDISYTENGYGSSPGYGDGTISRIKFTAKWHKSANGIGMNRDHLNFMPSLEDAQKCFDELKQLGYLDSNNQQTRVLYPDLDVMLSSACTNETIISKVKGVLGKYGYPKEYGFRFDYTDHMELRKAKYFVGTQEPTALRSNVFNREISGIDTIEKSRLIWEALKSKGYIVEDDKGYGSEGKTLLRSTLLEDLRSANLQFVKYFPLLKKFLVMQYAKQIASNSFLNIFSHWFPNASADGVSINKLLLQKNYFLYPLDMEFLHSLMDFKGFLPNIVDVLHRYFAVDRSEFDMESSGYDSNGNILHISNGYENYQFNYRENSNQISEIIADGQSQNAYRLHYDSRGNVIQALHKNIWRMEYHPVLNRLTKVLLTDETTIELSYNSKGERALKQVTNVEGNKLSKTEYFRDELGRTLVERRSTFVAADQQPDVLVTMYIYGPKSLVGFVRRDQFYSVIRDHEESIRLIVREGEVVAAYDYTPHGDLIRVYGTNPDAHILYRYTGQELDPELGLYNFQARMYDPTIGRFYQTDPMAQYFSPYNYAGNSPVSMVDYNGEVAFLKVAAVIFFAILGAYLGGITVNESLNPLDWHWSSRDTQLAVFIGAVTGALIPLGFSATISALGGLSLESFISVTSMGLAVSYLSVAGKNEELNPAEWELSRTTLNAGFEGFSMGAGMVGGWRLAIKKFFSLGKKGKAAFAGAAVIYGGQMFIVGGESTDWDLSKAEFWLNTVTSVASTFDIAMLGRSIIKFVRKRSGKLVKSFANAKKSIHKIAERVRKFHLPSHQAILDIFRLKRIKFPKITLKRAQDMLTIASFATFSITGGYLMNGDFAQQDQTHLQTYTNLLSAQVVAGQYLEAFYIVKSVEKPVMPTNQMAGTVTKTMRGAATQIRNIKRLIRVKRSPTESKVQLSSAQSAVANDFQLSVQLQDTKLVFIRKRFTDPFIIAKDDAPINNLSPLANLLGSVPEIIQQMIYDQFHKWDINSQITTDLDPDIIEKTKQKIEELMRSNNNSRIIDRDSIERYIGKFPIKNAETRSLQQQYLSTERELTVLETKLNFTSIRPSVKVKFLIEEKNYKMKMKDLKWQESEVIRKARNSLEEIVWNKLEKIYEDSVENFEIENFVGQQIVELEKSIYLPNPNAFEPAQDINFLTSLETQELPVFTTFQRCYNCIRTALKARLHVNDIHWLAFLNAAHTEPPQLANENENGQRQIQRKRRFIGNEDHTNSANWKKNRSYFEKIRNTFHSTWNGRNQSHQPSALNRKSVENEQQKLFPNITATPWNLMDFGDKLVAQLATNETLLLAEVLLAKYKKCKLFRLPADNSHSVYTTELALACEVTLLAEQIIAAAANASEIPMDYLDMSGEFELQKKIHKMLMQKRFDKIPDLLISFALDALPEGNNPKFGKLSRRKINRYQTFLKSFNFNSQIDAIFRKLVTF